MNFQTVPGTYVHNKSGKNILKANHAKRNNKVP